MILSGKIFKDNITSTTNISTVRSYMESDLSYTIYNILNSIEESASIVNETYIKQNHYASITYDYNILREGLNDIIDDIKEFFVKLIKKIKELWNNFILNIRSYLTSFSKFLENNRDRIMRLENKQIKYEGYEYTININVPNTNILYDIINTFNKEISQIKLLTPEKVDKMINNFKNDKSKNILRGKFLNRNTTISEYNFSTEITKVFRNNVAAHSTLLIDKSYIITGMDEYHKIHNLLADTEKEKNEITNAFENLKQIFNDSPNIIDNDGVTVSFNRIDINDNEVTKNNESIKQEYDYDKMEMYNKFYKYKFDYTKFASSCITNIYTEKIKAIKEALKQFESIFRAYVKGKDGIIVKVSESSASYKDMWDNYHIQGDTNYLISYYNTRSDYNDHIKLFDLRTGLPSTILNESSFNNYIDSVGTKIYKKYWSSGSRGPKMNIYSPFKFYKYLNYSNIWFSDTYYAIKSDIFHRPILYFYNFEKNKKRYSVILATDSNDIIYDAILIQNDSKIIHLNKSMIK